MTTVDTYLDNLEKPVRAELQRVRTIVHSTVPEAEECISYGMPVFKYNNQYLIGLAGFKNHMSLFPGSGPIEALRDELEDFKLSKGTIQFTLDNAIPEQLINKVVLSCLNSTVERAK